jgi:hypothetical protein
LGAVTSNERGPRGGFGEPIEHYILELAASNQLNPTGEFVVMDTAQMGIVGEMAVMPALTVPIQRKNDFEFPMDHQERLARAHSSGSGPVKVLTHRSGGWCRRPRGPRSDRRRLTP